MNKVENIEKYADKIIEVAYNNFPLVDSKDNVKNVIIELINELLEQTWNDACKAQMNAVLEHCTHSPQGTNGHAIKHWVKLVEFNKNKQII